ncbi:MAG: metal-dependent hydrolase, partial [Candidatus Nanoarchaeia archaeon]
MLGTTHLLFSFLFGSFIFKFVGGTFITKVFWTSALLAGTFLPDLDMKFKFLEHRGLLHTIWLPLALLILGGLVTKLQILFLPFAIGFLSHLFADALNPSGVAFFAPISNYRLCG